MMISPLTYKMVALLDVVQIDAKECIDWAVEMLLLGYETPSLLIVAACSSRSSFFELKPYMEKALQELGLKPKNGDAAIISYCSFFIRAIAKGEDVKGKLAELHRFCQHTDCDGDLFDFQSLYWAWDDIDFLGDEYPTHYWPDVNQENIEATVRKVASDWLGKHKDLFSLESY